MHLPWASKNCNAVIWDSTISRGIKKASKQEREWHRVYESALSDLLKVAATMNINKLKNSQVKAGEDVRKRRQSILDVKYEKLQTAFPNLSSRNSF